MLLIATTRYCHMSEKNQMDVVKQPPEIEQTIQKVLTSQFIYPTISNCTDPVPQLETFLSILFGLIPYEKGKFNQK